jgi:predicted negative regulator of RcsB-dependent stress response
MDSFSFLDIALFFLAMTILSAWLGWREYQRIQKEGIEQLRRLYHEPMKKRKRTRTHVYMDNKFMGEKEKYIWKN